MENYLLLKNKLQNQTIAVFSSLVCLVLIITVLATNQNKGLKVGLLSLGLLSSIVGITANKASFENSELLEDSEFIERENRLNKLQTFQTPTTSIKEPSKVVNVAIKEPSENWLQELALNSYHFRIAGETGSGKSTFIDNLMTCLTNSFEGDVDFVLIDPKYPLSDFEIMPQYKGVAESLNGLVDLAGEVESRLSKATLCKDNGLEIPKFKPKVFIIDEIDRICCEYGKEVAKLLRIGLKIGRALNIKVAYIGQSPICSALYLNKNDFKNSANILLGDMALLGMSEIVYGKQRKQIELELIARQESNDVYYALVKPMSKAPFTAKLPTPKFYSKVKK